MEQECLLLIPFVPLSYFLISDLADLKRLLLYSLSVLLQVDVILELNSVHLDHEPRTVPPAPLLESV